MAAVVLVVAAWIGSQGYQERQAPRYCAPSATLHQAPSASLVMRQSAAQVTQLSTHTPLHLTDMHLLSVLYLNLTSFHEQLFLIVGWQDEQKLETVRAQQRSSDKQKEKL